MPKVNGPVGIRGTIVEYKIGIRNGLGFQGWIGAFWGPCGMLTLGAFVFIPAEIDCKWEDGVV